MAKKQDLIDRLKGLYRKRRNHTGKVGKHTMAELRRMIKAEEAMWICSACGGRLSILKWNKGLEIILCDNFSCPNYRRPVGSIPSKAGKAG